MDDPKRVDPPDEPSTMPEPRFSKMPESIEDKNLIIDKCILGSLQEFEVLMDCKGMFIFHSLLQEMPGHFDISKPIEDYTVRELRHCVSFLKNAQNWLEAAVDDMPLDEINDLFLEEL